MKGGSWITPLLPGANNNNNNKQFQSPTPAKENNHIKDKPNINTLSPYSVQTKCKQYDQNLPQSTPQSRSLHSYNIMDILPILSPIYAHVDASCGGPQPPPPELSGIWPEIEVCAAQNSSLHSNTVADQNCNIYVQNDTAATVYEISTGNIQERIMIEKVGVKSATLLSQNGAQVEQASMAKIKPPHSSPFISRQNQLLKKSDKMSSVGNGREKYCQIPETCVDTGMQTDSSRLRSTEVKMRAPSNNDVIVFNHLGVI